MDVGYGPAQITRSGYAVGGGIAFPAIGFIELPGSTMWPRPALKSKWGCKRRVMNFDKVVLATFREIAAPSARKPSRAAVDMAASIEEGAHSAFLTTKTAELVDSLANGLRGTCRLVL